MLRGGNLAVRLLAVTALELLVEVAALELPGPGAPSAGGSEGLPAIRSRGAGAVRAGRPEKRKVMRSLMFSYHFEGPCGFGMIFPAFNSRWELLLFRATFLTQNATPRALVRKKPV